MALSSLGYQFLSLLLCSLFFALVYSLKCPDHEKLALLQFKQSFVIDCTASQSADAYPKTKSWSDDGNGDCCSWDGVVCSNQTSHINVIGLNLRSSCLSGSFPANSSLFRLTQLQQLSLSDNDFNYSRIPSEVGQLSKMRELELASSAFSGQIPLEISRMLELSVLDLQGNVGSSVNSESRQGLVLRDPSLGRLVQNLSRLSLIILDSVDISSPVPNVLGNLSYLQGVSFQYCNLIGEFPSSIFSLPHLEILALTGNTELRGFLPEFQHTSRLRRLELPYTAFSGELPPSIGNLAHLEGLRLVSCNFSGPIPSSLGNLTKLNALELGENSFTGDIPSCVTNLTQLQFLVLSDLNMNPDKLSSWLSKLNNMIRLDLQDMNLVSQSLSFLANFSSLGDLNLNGNQLTGQIPHWLMNATQLWRLSLSNNYLKGPIPPGISQLGDLETLYLYGNDNLYGNFDAFWKLRYLSDLDLSGIELTFDSNLSANESAPKFTSLYLNGCNLTEFPPFLRNQDQLQVLSLMYNNIHGLIPQWFVNQTEYSLYSLGLTDNLITGFEQPAAVLPWNNLEVLYLEGNMLKGSLPLPSKSIVVYQVSNNSLSGGFPQELCHATSLNYLDISFNNLSGRIPECIGDLGGSLYILNLQGNAFYGPIPHVPPKSCKLKMINLSQNRLEGNMPRSLANCIMLEVLDIGNNHINDTFPSWLGSLPNLQVLVLRHNNFYGKLGRPNAKDSFPSLRIIDISHNFHTGELPSDYLQNWSAMRITNEGQASTSGTIVTFMLSTPTPTHLFPSLEYDYTITITNKGNDILYSKILTIFRVIDFSSNNFTGRIPYLIGDLRGLQAVNLSNNNLEGNIPLSLSEMKDLQSLDLSNNLLSGEIPQQITQITSLEVFNVSHNHITGPIPQGRQFSSFDNSSFEGNTGLCGAPLSNKCGNIEHPPPFQRTNDHTEEDSKLIDWIVRASGYVGGFIVGYVIGKIFITDRYHDWFMETFNIRKSKTRAKRATRQRS